MYGASKSSSGPSESSASSGSVPGHGSSSSGSSSSGMSGSSSSCACNFLFEVDLLNDSSFLLYITNMADCDLIITAITYRSGGAVSIGTTLPATIAGGTFITIAASEGFDVRGLTVDVTTDHCGVAEFEVPIS